MRSKVSKRRHDPWSELSAALRRQLGTARSEPTTEQLENIVEDLAKVVEDDRKISKQQWKAVVRRHVPSAGQHSTFAVDNSDLDRLIREILEKLGPRP